MRPTRSKKPGRQATCRNAAIAQSGQVMSAVALLKEIRKPTDRDIDLAMNGNICRCATYARIRSAIHDAARTLEG